MLDAGLMDQTRQRITAWWRWPQHPDPNSIALRAMMFNAIESVCIVAERLGYDSAAIAEADGILRAHMPAAAEWGRGDEGFIGCSVDTFIDLGRKHQALTDDEIKGFTRGVRELTRLDRRLGGMLDEGDYKPSTWFPKKMRSTLRMAASKDRKTKRVRTRFIDGVRFFNVEDARRWYPNDTPPKDKS